MVLSYHVYNGLNTFSCLKSKHLCLLTDSCATFASCDLIARGISTVCHRNVEDTSLYSPRHESRANILRKKISQQIIQVLIMFDCS